MPDAYAKDPASIDKAKLVECIQACFDCAQTCTVCADAGLSEDIVAELTKCIRTNLDYVDICAATGKILSRHGSHDADITRAVLEACRTACKACADECRQRAARYRHCEVCTEACRCCEQACTELLASLG
jgi:uncharacterized membrane protein